MPETNLPRVARRVLNTPQLISEAGAIAVLGALGPRIGVGSVRMPSGEVRTLEPSAATPMQPRTAAQSTYGVDRCFAFDPETGIATIPIEGELVHRFGHLDPYSGMTGYDGINQKIIAAATDPAVKGILLDIDSPGGEVYGCAACAATIYAARAAKPVWAVVNELAASAAYWLASAAHNVFLPATADTGSIGVVMMHVDISRALDAEGLTVTLIHAGAHKVDGWPFEPLPEDVKANFQAGVDAVYDVYTGAVAQYRAMPEAKVRATEARVYMGADAVTAGLADAVAPVDDVIAEFAAQLLSRSTGLTGMVAAATAPA